MITVLYFASIKDRLGRARESIELPQGVANIAALAARLRERGEDWSEALADGANLKVALNQSMASPEAALKDGDEVAFFPPVTGG